MALCDIDLLNFWPLYIDFLGALLAQTGIILFNYLFTYLSLVRQKPDFESVKEVGEKEEQEHEEKDEKKRGKGEEYEKSTKVVLLTAAGDAKSDGSEKGKVVSAAESQSSRSRMQQGSLPLTVTPKPSYFSKYFWLPTYRSTSQLYYFTE